MAIAVELGDDDRVSVDDRLVDDVALPRAIHLSIDYDLVAVPWLDRGEVTFAVDDFGACPTAAVEPMLIDAWGFPRRSRQNRVARRPI